MNVLIAIPCLLKGGTEMQTLHLVRALNSAGHRITTLCYFEWDDAMVEDFNSLGGNVRLLRWERDVSALRFISQLRKEIKALSPEIVHVQYMAPGALPVLAARLAGARKVVATVHQPWTRSHGRFARILLRAAAFFCTRFIAVSQSAEKSWFGSSQLYDENRPLRRQPRHFTLYNAVEVKRIAELACGISVNDERLRLKLPAESIVIGVVGRLRWEKGVDLLIRAFQKVAEKNTDVHLLIVGGGPDEEKLKRLTENGGGRRETGDGITFFGEADWETAMRQMALMDVVVVPSRFEGFGLSAAEAMAMGKPVIASEVFGLSEVVTDGETGLLFPAENIAALKECVSRLADDPALRIKLGTNGKRKAEKQFDLSVFSDKIVKLYELL